jgi:hypothetical protein
MGAAKQDVEDLLRKELDKQRLSRDQRLGHQTVGRKPEQER